MWPQFNTAEKISLISATAITLIALFAALRSRRANLIASEALELSKRSFSMSVKSQRGDDCLVLSPVGSEQEINNLVLYFPHKIGLKPIALVSGNLKLWDVRISSALLSYWDSSTPAKPGRIIGRGNLSIPVVIRVQGHAKGVATVTLAIYDLYVQYVRTEQQSSLQIKALALNNYVLVNDDPQTLSDLADTLLAEMETNRGPGINGQSY
jgi:hypothetical protein